MHRLREVLIAALFVAGCSSGAAQQATPSATLATSPSTAAVDTAAIKHEVEVAYLRSWDVYAHALRTLSTDGLEGSFSGPALVSTTAEVAHLRDMNTPVQMVVEHAYEIAITLDSATVLDRYKNHAVLLDAATGAPTEPDPNDSLAFSYVIKKVGSSWLITDITRM